MLGKVGKVKRAGEGEQAGWSVHPGLSTALESLSPGGWPPVPLSRSVGSIGSNGLHPFTLDWPGSFLGAWG